MRPERTRSKHAWSVRPSQRAYHLPYDMRTSTSRHRWLIALATSVAGGLLFFTIGGCNRTPSGPIADSVMVQALMEVHLLRARAAYRETEDIPDSIRALQDSALIRRGVSPEDFQSMLDVYAEEPERYQDVYTSVVDSLNSLRVRLSDATRDSVVLDSMIQHPPKNVYPPVKE